MPPNLFGAPNFVSRKICYKRNKNKNLALLNVFFPPSQTLKPGYGPDWTAGCPESMR